MVRKWSKGPISLSYTTSVMVSEMLSGAGGVDAAAARAYGFKPDSTLALIKNGFAKIESKSC
jgi:hypothetical protein